MAAKIRVALGDARSETEKLTADESFAADSLEASRDYSMAQNLANNGKDEEATREEGQKAVKLYLTTALYRYNYAARRRHRRG